MTEKNMSRPLTEFQAAERICRIIAETNPLSAEEEVRAFVAKRRAERSKVANEQIAKLMARVPEARRAHVAKHVVSAGYELGGFEIEAANDAPLPDWANKPPKETSRAVQIDRGAK